MKRANITIFGATSHIAKGLISNLLADGEHTLHLYTRSSAKLMQFLESIDRWPTPGCVIHEGYADFKDSTSDVIINCIGAGTMGKAEEDYTAYFTLTEEYDNMIIGYLLNKHPHTLYISLSSGAVYGRGRTTPADHDSSICICPNNISKQDYYAIARINAEAKHRAFHKLRIIDLRIFSYFSRFIDLDDNYFITELLRCVMNKTIFAVDCSEFLRDYLHPMDLYAMVRKCLDANRVNTAFDVTSAKPATKKEILDFFSSEYGLRYSFNTSAKVESPTGVKPTYCSSNHGAAAVGYKAAFSSMDTIRGESKHILETNCRALKR